MSQFGEGELGAEKQQSKVNVGVGGWVVVGGMRGLP